MDTENEPRIPVSSVIPLKGMDYETYDRLRKSGMFGVWYPEATWNYEEDTGLVHKGNYYDS